MQAGYRTTVWLLRTSYDRQKLYVVTSAGFCNPFRNRRGMEQLGYVSSELFKTAPCFYPLPITFASVAPISAGETTT